MGLRLSGTDLPKAAVTGDSQADANKSTNLRVQSNPNQTRDSATTKGGVHPAPADGVDRASELPGAAFVNSLVGLDRDGNGVLERPELERGRARLNALARDGRGNDRAEMAVVGALERAAQAGTDVVATIRV